MKHPPAKSDSQGRIEMDSTWSGDMQTSQAGTQHSAHVYAFLNAPLSQRRLFANGQLAVLDARLAKGGYRSADDYYADRDEALRIRAALQNKTAREIAPMTFWYGRQSN